MVVSLFSRKDRSGPRKGVRSPVRGNQAPASRDSRRESALRTEQAIDRIESEMTGKSPGSLPASEAGRSRSAVPPRGGNGQRADNGTKTASTFAGQDPADAIVIDVQGSELPAILEESAVLYANGQSQLASGILHRCIDDAGLGTHQPLAWLMLLDLYQCTDDRTAFEALAAQYAGRFDTTSPAWNAALSPTGDASPTGKTDLPAAPAGQMPSDPADAADGVAVASRPGELMLCGPIDGSIERLLRRLMDSDGTQAQLDVSTVTAVDAASAQALLGLLGHFERDSRPLVIRGARRLYGLLRTCIEPGRRDASEACWMLALQLLRVLDCHEEFEDLAIEYCITYEVSPPSWEPCAPSIRQPAEDPALMETESPATDAVVPPASVAGASAAPGGQSGELPADDEEPAVTAAAAGRAYVLQGEVSGRMQDGFEALRAYAAERGDVVIDCRRLRRIEFVAAGDLLNEIATMRSAGRQVLFIEPNYLVYALMLVMGIHDLAEIRRRRI